MKDHRRFSADTKECLGETTRSILIIYLFLFWAESEGHPKGRNISGMRERTAYLSKASYSNDIDHVREPRRDWVLVPN